MNIPELIEEIERQRGLLLVVDAQPIDPRVAPMAAYLNVKDVVLNVLKGADAMTRTGNPIMQFFVYEHLDEPLRSTSKAVGDLAREMEQTLPASAETSAGLRHLLEAKDCFVRAKLSGIQRLTVAEAAAGRDMAKRGDDVAPPAEVAPLTPGHDATCAWQLATCEYKATHNYCPHPEHACTCAPRVGTGA